MATIVEGKLTLEGWPCQKNVPHLIPNWVVEVVDDVEPTVVEGSKLSFPGLLQGDETYIIDGPTMRKLAVEKRVNKGLSDVPALLGKDGKGLKTLIMAEKVHIIILPGTVLRISGDGLCVPYLGLGGGGWRLDFVRLDGDWWHTLCFVSCE